MIFESKIEVVVGFGLGIGLAMACIVVAVVLVPSAAASARVAVGLSAAVMMILSVCLGLAIYWFWQIYKTPTAARQLEVAPEDKPTIKAQLSKTFSRALSISTPRAAGAPERGEDEKKFIALRKHLEKKILGTERLEVLEYDLNMITQMSTAERQTILDLFKTASHARQAKMIMDKKLGPVVAPVAE